MRAPAEYSHKQQDDVGFFSMKSANWVGSLSIAEEKQKQTYEFVLKTAFWLLAVFIPQYK